MLQLISPQSENLHLTYVRTPHLVAARGRLRLICDAVDKGGLLYFWWVFDDIQSIAPLFDPARFSGLSHLELHSSFGRAPVSIALHRISE